MTLEKAMLDHALGIHPRCFWARAKGFDADAVKPYVSLDPPPSGFIEYDSAHVGTELLTLRVHVWATAMHEARELLKAIESGFCFSEEEFNVTDTQVLSISKGSDSLMPDPDQSAEGDDLWHGVLDLQLLVAREPGH